MIQSSCKLTVLFQNQFWVGIFEDECENEYSVARVVLGSEPTEAQLYEFILKNYNKIPFKKIQSEAFSTQKKTNYKRLQREVKKQQKEVKKQQKEIGVGTKAQNAIKLQQESAKVERRRKRKERKESDRDKMYELKQMKKKEKHKGH